MKGFYTYPNKLDQLYFLYVARNTEPLCRYKDVVHLIWKNYFLMNLKNRLAEIWTERFGIPFPDAKRYARESIFRGKHAHEKYRLAFEKLFSSLVFYQLLKKPWFIGFLPFNLNVQYPSGGFCYLRDYWICFSTKGPNRWLIVENRASFVVGDIGIIDWVKKLDKIQKAKEEEQLKKRRLNV